MRSEPGKRHGCHPAPAARARADRGAARRARRQRVRLPAPERRGGAVARRDALARGAAGDRAARPLDRARRPRRADGRPRRAARAARPRRRPQRLGQAHRGDLRRPARQGGGRGQVARTAARAPCPPTSAPRSSATAGSRCSSTRPRSCAPRADAGSGRRQSRRPPSPRPPKVLVVEDSLTDPRAPAQHPRGGRLSRADGPRRPRRAHPHRSRRADRPRRHRRRDARDGRHRADPGDPRARDALDPARWSSSPSLGEDDDRRRGIEAGADAYMVKNAFDQHDLLETVERLVGPMTAAAPPARSAACSSARTPGPTPPGSSRLLARDPEIEVVGVCASAEETIARLRAARSRTSSRWTSSCPGCRGGDAIEQIMSAQPVPDPRALRRRRSAGRRRRSRRSAPARSRCSPRTRSTSAIPTARTRGPSAGGVKLLAGVRGAPSPARAPEPAAAGAGGAARAASVIGICASAGRPAGARRRAGRDPGRRSRSRSSSSSTSPTGFTEGFARWLDDQVPLPVRLARAGPAGPGIWVAPEGAHLTLDGGGRLVARRARRRRAAPAVRRRPAAQRGGRRRRRTAWRSCSPAWAATAPTGSATSRACRRPDDRAGRGQLRRLRHAQGGGRARRRSSSSRCRPDRPAAAGAAAGGAAS